SAVHALVRRVADPTWARLGWEPSASSAPRLAITRARLLSVLGLSGKDGDVRREANERFGRFLADKSGLSADLLTPVAHVVAAAGGEEGWTTILDQYRSAATPQDKIRYLLALPETSSRPLLVRTLDLALSDEVRTQDAPFLVAGVMSNRAGGAEAWEWLERRWDEIRDRLPPGLVARIFEGIPSLVDPAIAASVHAFAASHELPLAGPRVDQLLERMDINVALAARLHGTIAAALAR
ncbi:MAG TPA: ERAP1-like C-terminal domain-containing protein, partial [Acidimicrobiales bacterium]